MVGSKNIEKVLLSSLLEEYFGTSEDGLTQWPEDVKEWVKLVFIPRPLGPGLWAELDPDKRRMATAQWDEHQAFMASSERKIAWYDQILRASSWWNRASVSPAEAALLLCYQDPNDANGTHLSSTNDETKPEHYQELLRLFEEVNILKPGHRRLKDWVFIAQEDGLKHHSWVTDYAKAISESALEDGVGESRTAAEAAAAEAVAADKAAAAAATEAGLTKRQRQVQAIVAVLEKLKFPALCIPKGGKTQLLKECQTSYPELFGGGRAPFLDAWKVAVKQGLVRVANHSSYSGK